MDELQQQILALALSQAEKNSVAPEETVDEALRLIISLHNVESHEVKLFSALSFLVAKFKKAQQKLSEKKDECKKQVEKLLQEKRVPPILIQFEHLRVDKKFSEFNATLVERFSEEANTVVIEKRDGTKKRHEFKVTELLETWFQEHLSSPYPNKEEKRELSERTGLTAIQVNNWFYNKRSRTPKADGDESSSTDYSYQQSESPSTSHIAEDNEEGNSQSLCSQDEFSFSLVCDEKLDHEDGSGKQDSKLIDGQIPFSGLIQSFSNSHVADSPESEPASDISSSLATRSDGSLSPPPLSSFSNSITITDDQLFFDCEAIFEEIFSQSPFPTSNKSSFDFLSFWKGHCICRK